MRVKIRATLVIPMLVIILALPAVAAMEAPGSPADEARSFSEAFVTVPNNPLPGDLSWLLWLISQEPVSVTVNTAPLSPLAQAAVKFAALISSQGVYYKEVTRFMGMEMKAEYWMKGEQFKKIDHMQDQVTVFDGTWFYKYSDKLKTGVRLSPDDPQALPDITSVKNYTLSLAAQAPYQQQEDKKVKPFDCQVFYMEMELMGVKGNWLYLDKKTGALVKNQYGKEKGGMSVVVTKLQVGGFGDEAFAVPGNIQIERN